MASVETVRLALAHYKATLAAWREEVDETGNASLGVERAVTVAQDNYHREVDEYDAQEK